MREDKIVIQDHENLIKLKKPQLIGRTTSLL